MAELKPQNPATKMHAKAANQLFKQPCEFIAGAANYDAIPNATFPEVAFAGRSNVGKSSLINALTGRKTLARMSSTPGRTQQLNFFSLAEKLILVDLPGHGYAKASKTKIAQWTQLVHDYLKGRTSLKRVYVLIDARHGIKEADLPTLQLLDEYAVSYQIVLTKLDRTPSNQVEKIIENVRESLTKHPAAHPEILATSSEKKIGIETLRIAITEVTGG
jgi:GTP-binding protein